MTRPLAPEPDRQLPTGEEIFLDHIGHFVRDPQAAARALTRAGFAPTPVSIQSNPDPDGGAPRPTGTGNITAMLKRGYIEVLFKTAETPLGREFDAAMARYPGVHLAAFAVADAANAHRRLAASGFRVRPLAEMQRPVDFDEKVEMAAFTIARLEPDEMPEGRIQILTHRTEHIVWQPRWLAHPNGALGLVSVAIVVADANAAAERFARFTGRPANPTSFGRSIRLDRGRVDLMTADAYVAIIPDIPPPSLPFIAACGIAVRSLEAVESILATGKLPMRRLGESLVATFPEELGRGAWLFTAASASGGDPR
jgi:hypothetical protein